MEVLSGPEPVRRRCRWERWVGWGVTCKRHGRAMSESDGKWVFGRFKDELFEATSACSTWSFVFLRFSESQDYTIHSQMVHWQLLTTLGLGSERVCK